jgi:hypothetical protein
MPAYENIVVAQENPQALYTRTNKIFGGEVLEAPWLHDAYAKALPCKIKSRRLLRAIWEVISLICSLLP